MLDITPLATTETDLPGVTLAKAMRAGPWIFCTGHLAGTLNAGPLPAVVADPSLPHHGRTRYRREGDAIIAGFAAILESQGADLTRAVRLDQYYPDWRAVDRYHQARKASFGGHIPPSTSVIMKEVMIPGCGMDISLIAVAGDPAMAPKRVVPENVPVPEFSGFVPALTAGDYVFVAGQMANTADMAAVEPRATKPPRAVWNGTEIRLQTRFLIEQRLRPAMEAAGSSLANAVKAQVYLADIADTADFLDVWNEYFADAPCALSIVPTAAFGHLDCIIEINMLGVRDEGRVKKEIIAADLPRGAAFGPAAVRAGDLVCLSGLMAADDNGPIVPADLVAALRHTGGGARRQMREILTMAARICEAAGTDLKRVVRAHHFLLDLHDFPATQYAWGEAVGAMALPSGAVCVPGPMPVPGCTVMLDMWAIA